MFSKTDLWTYLSKTNKAILMYGMGNGADKILEVCSRYGIEIADFFASDGFVRGHQFHGKRVLSYSEAKEKYGVQNMIVLLSFASSLPDVLENIYRIDGECELYAPDVPVCGDTLFNMEFYNQNKESIHRVEELLCDWQSKKIYRDIIAYKLSGKIEYLKSSHSSFDEVYRELLGAENFEYAADLGAYNGDTLRELKQYAEGLIEAYALEPDRRNFRKLTEYSAAESAFKINAYQTAAWSKQESLIFGGSGNRNSSLISGARVAVAKQAKIVETDANSLDNILSGKRVDYIKYDVEGSEWEALSGSLETIKKYKPALAISLYHRSEDLFKLPLFVNEHFPEYKFYLRRRQYIPAWDSMLIAVNNK